MQAINAESGMAVAVAPMAGIAYRAQKAHRNLIRRAIADW